MSTLTRGRPISSAIARRLIASHGLHHGAQKSTMTGTGEASTSAANVSSVTSRIGSRAARERAQPQEGTIQAASATIDPVIFESPTRPSTKRIGTSRTQSPARSTRYVVSIWKPYPRAEKGRGRSPRAPPGEST